MHRLQLKQLKLSVRQTVVGTPLILGGGGWGGWGNECLYILPLIAEEVRDFTIWIYCVCIFLLWSLLARCLEIIISWCCCNFDGQGGN